MAIFSGGSVAVSVSSVLFSIKAIAIPNFSAVAHILAEFHTWFQKYPLPLLKMSRNITFFKATSVPVKLLFLKANVQRDFSNQVRKCHWIFRKTPISKLAFVFRTSLNERVSAFVRAFQ